LAVSALSFWEVASLHQSGQLELPCPAARWRAEVLDGGVAA